MCQPQDAPVLGRSACGSGHRGYRLPFLCASHYPPFRSGHKGETAVHFGTLTPTFTLLQPSAAETPLITPLSTFQRRHRLNTFTMKQSVCCWKPWMNWKWRSTTRLCGQTATTSSSILSPQSSWIHQRFVQLPSLYAVMLHRTLLTLNIYLFLNVL